MKKLLITIVGVSLLTCLISPTAMALRFPSAEELFPTDETVEQDQQQDPNAPEDEIDEERTRRQVPVPTGNLFTDVFPVVLRLALWAMGVILFIVLSYAGVRLVISRGDEDDMTKVKELIIHILIGIAVVGGAFGLISGLLRVLLNL